MKSFVPEKLFKRLPRFFELVIKSVPFLFLITVLFFFHFFDLVYGDTGHKRDFLSTLIASFFAYYYSNLYQTRTIVDLIIIDEQNEKITVAFSQYYIFPRKKEIPFSDFKFNYYDAAGMTAPYTVIIIFNGGQIIAKLVTRNGWSNDVVNQIISEFNKISPTEKLPKRYL
jgi:hypothetical protein